MGGCRVGECRVGEVQGGRGVEWEGCRVGGV